MFPSKSSSKISRLAEELPGSNSNISVVCDQVTIYANTNIPRTIDVPAPGISVVVGDNAKEGLGEKPKPFKSIINDSDEKIASGSRKRTLRKPKDSFPKKKQHIIQKPKLGYIISVADILKDIQPFSRTAVTEVELTRIINELDFYDCLSLQNMERRDKLNLFFLTTDSELTGVGMSKDFAEVFLLAAHVLLKDVKRREAIEVTVALTEEDIEVID